MKIIMSLHQQNKYFFFSRNIKKIFVTLLLLLLFHIKMVVVVSFLYCAPTDGAINACIIWHSSAVLYKYLLYVYIIVHTQHFIFSYSISTHRFCCFFILFRLFYILQQRVHV